MSTVKDVPKKDAPVGDLPEVQSAEYVPVPANNQPQSLTVNAILQGLGGLVETVKGGDEAVKLEGWVPPSNRNGKDDAALVKDKAFKLHKIDTEDELGLFPRIVDPRDNKDAPDEWSESPKK